MSKVGTVDDDENVRPRTDHRIVRFTDQTQELRKLSDDSRKAHDRQLRDWKLRFEPLAPHRMAADALEANSVAEALAKHLHQLSAEPVARLLRRDQEDLPRRIAICPDRHQPG